MAALLSRPLSVKFNTYSMKGLSHNEVLLELEKTIPKADIKSIQIQECECVVSVSSVIANNKLILSSTNIQYYKTGELSRCRMFVNKCHNQGHPL